jgi:hypothetical protein
MNAEDVNAEDMNDVSHDHTPEIGWGTPARPEEPGPAGSGPGNGWSTLRKAAFWSVLVLGVPAIGLGLYVVADDMSDTTDDWHGFGIAIGLILAVPCLVFCLLAGFGLRSMRRRGAAGGRVLATVLGMLLVALLMVVGLSPFLLLPVALGAALLLSVLADGNGRR